MEKVTIIKMDEVDLTNIIRQVIREEIKTLLNELKNEVPDNTLLTRKEALKCFKFPYLLCISTRNMEGFHFTE